MKNRQNVHPFVFVVRSLNGSAILEREDILNKQGKIEPLGKYFDLCLLYLDSPSDDPRETWRRIRDQLGAEFDLIPAFVDDRGNISYPTGKVWVQFRQTPTDDELNAYGRQWGLRLEARDKYMPNEAIFEKRKSALNQYLPDILESIRKDTQHVRAVSAIKISKFKI
jgi:hypothetical protein